jgi:hypothetical protein
MKNTNQHDRNDPHKVTKLKEEEWGQADTQLAKYAKTVNECRAETVSRTLFDNFGHCLGI